MMVEFVHTGGNCLGIVVTHEGPLTVDERAAIAKRVKVWATEMLGRDIPVLVVSHGMTVSIVG